MRETNYPTPAEIISNIPQYNRDTIDYMKAWKKIYMPRWKEKRGSSSPISVLAYGLTQLATNNPKPVEIVLSHQNKYDSSNAKIYLDITKPSIISTLHEVGHHLFGKSELKACAWSIGLFKKCFPRQFAALVWEQHQLVKPK